MLGKNKKNKKSKSGKTLSLILAENSKLILQREDLYLGQINLTPHFTSALQTPVSPLVGVIAPSV